MSRGLDRICGLLLALSSGTRSRPRGSLVLCAVVTLAFAAGLPRLEVRTDGAVLEDARDTEVMRATLDRERFGDGDGAVVLVTRVDGTRLDTPGGLDSLRALHDELSALPGVRTSGARSVASIPDLQASPERLSATAFLEAIPGDADAFAQWRDRLRAHPAVDGQLLAADGSAAVLWLPAAFGVEAHRLVASLSAHLEAGEDSPFRLRLLGPAVAESLLGAAVLDDLGRLIPLMVLVLTVGLLFTLRSLGALAVTMLEVALVLVWSFGAMAWLGRPLTLVTTALPVVLLTMAIADEVHLLERLQSELALGAELGAAMSTALRRLVQPLTVTTVTTCLALLSFCMSPLPPLRDFGAIAAFGMMVALLISLTIVPIVIERIPARWLVRRAPRRRPRVEAGASGSRARSRGPGLAAWVVRRRGLAALVGGVLLLATAPGLARLQVGDNWLANFPPDAEIVAADRDFNEAFWGSYHLDLVLEAAPGTFDTAAGARLVEWMIERVESDEVVRGVTSYLTPVGVVMAAHGERGMASELDDLRLGDYIVLAGMSEDPQGLGAFLTADGSMTRIRLSLDGEDYARDRRLLDDLAATLRPQAAEAGVALRFGGETADGVAMVERTVRSQLSSVLWAYLVLGAFALGVAPRGLDGLVLLVPVLAAVVAVFGWMGLLGLRLGVATSMFAGLTVGVGVDFGVHLLAAWRRARESASGLDESLLTAWREAGRGVSFNTVVLAAGLSVLALSVLRSNQALGLLLGAAVIASFVFSAAFLPLSCAAIERLRRRPRAGAPMSRRALRTGVSSILAASGMLLVGALIASSPVLGSDRAADDAAARLAMADIEQRFRSTPRLVQLAIDTERPREATAIGRPERERVELWGVIDGDRATTSMLFVYAAPRRMRGTGLLLDDVAGSLWQQDGPARMFFHMRTFDRFRAIPRSSLNVRVQGTCLTYEDAHGFFSGGKYDIFAGDGEAVDGELRVVARPVTDDLASDLGFSEARLLVDRHRHLVLHVALHDAAGRLVREVEVTEAATVGDALWLPRRSRVHDHESGVVSRVETTAWLLPAPPPSGLFDRRVEDRAFLARFLRAVRGFGLDSAIRRLEDAVAGEVTP
ncbi:MAG: MMPL family transporter [Acidobacteriota bacterium]